MHLFARNMVLIGGMSAHVGSLLQLVAVLENNDERKRQFARCPDLFVDRFEEQFPNDEIPITSYQRFLVQEFMLGRVNAGLRTYLTAPYPLEGLKWWSTDLKSHLRPAFVDIKI